jgi:hypothetical protein
MCFCSVKKTYGISSGGLTPRILNVVYYMEVIHERDRFSAEPETPVALKLVPGLVWTRCKVPFFVPEI